MALALMAAWACESRDRARVDGVDPTPDHGAPDAGRDAGRPTDARPVDPPDARRPDAATRDVGPVDAGPVDAGPADAGPTDGSRPDAAPDGIGHTALTTHDGRSGCPRAARLPAGDPPQWRVAAPIARHGQTAGAGWIEGRIVGSAPADLDDGPGPAGGLLEAVVPAGALYGVWRSGGATRDGWRIDGAWRPQPVDAEPIAEAFDATAPGGGRRLVVRPRADGVTVTVDDGAGAPPRVHRFDGERPLMARVVADRGGFVVGWSSAGVIELRFVDADGGVIAAALPALTSEFDLATDGERLGLAYVTGDPRLDGLPYAAGYGRPTLAEFRRADGGLARTMPLHADAIRGGRPAIGARDDGWLVAWSRLRVDGDRNRSEIGVVRIGADGVGTPRRLTRAHGFSFCPTVGDALDGASLVAWMDTANGREEIRYAVGDFDDWPVDDVPEPTPAPPAFPDGCQAAADAIAVRIDALDAWRYRDGFMAAWIGPAGVEVGFVGPAGGARAQWRVAPGGPVPDAIRVVPDGDAWLIVGVTGDRITGWTTAGTAGDPPVDLAPLAPLDPGPLHDVSGGDEGAYVVRGDPPVVARFPSGSAERALPPDARSPRALATGRGVVVGWHRLVDGDPGAPTELGWLDLDDDGDWADVAPSTVRVPAYADPQGFDLWPVRSGWRILFDAHRGRPYARAVLGLSADGIAAGPGRLDLDAASSTGPVGFGGYALWLEERPIDRFQVHYADPAGDVWRLPVPGPQRARLFLNVVDGDPVVLWTAGVQTRIARFDARCRLPAASAP